MEMPLYDKLLLKIMLKNTVKLGDLDRQGNYDNAPSNFDRVYYRAVQILLITNYATLVLTCTVHVICI